MEDKHTPIESQRWFVDEESNGQLWICNIENDCVPIAQLNQGEDHNRYEITQEDREVAQLIAKAPELLQANRSKDSEIKELVEALRDAVSQITELTDSEIFTESYKRLLTKYKDL